ncbi:MAG: hypothetical protein JW946_01540 [Candidatus Omnitrophica bacterium]|nr:hypothetical protein [Candidatus Omnitrophota bacterium]
MKKGILHPVHRMLSRRKWLLILAFLPLLIPVQTVKPHYKVTLEIKLKPPSYVQSDIERMRWLGEQAEALNNEKILLEAMKKARFPQDLISREFEFIKNNMNVTAEGADTLKIELIMLQKDRLKMVATEFIDIYFKEASRINLARQEKIYTDKKARLEKLNTELKEAKAGLDAAAAAFNSFKTDAGINNIQSLKSEIDDLKAKLRKLQVVYTEEHPSVKELKNQIIVKTNDLKTMQAQIEQENKKHASLSSAYSSSKEFYDKILQQHKLAEQITVPPADSDMGDVVSGPDVADVGMEKIKMLDLSGRVLLGIALLFFAAFIIEGSDKTVWNEKEIRSDLSIRTLASIAKPKKQTAGGLLTNYPKDSEFFKSFEVFRSNIQFINLATSLKTILYSSLLKDEDLAAVNLAVSMSFIGGRVCLVDVKNNAKKLSDLVAKAGSNTGVKNLKVTDAAGFNLADKQQAANFIAGLKEKFDVVIIDAPPITDSVECATLASVTDGIILGAKFRKTEREFLLRNYKILNDINARVLGAVLQW